MVMGVVPGFQKKGLNLKRSPGGILLKMCGQVWTSAKKCDKEPKRFWPSVVALYFL